jgi:hypothetical protein
MRTFAAAPVLRHKVVITIPFCFLKVYCYSFSGTEGRVRGQERYQHSGLLCQRDHMKVINLMKSQASLENVIIYKT